MIKNNSSISLSSQHLVSGPEQTQDNGYLPHLLARQSPCWPPGSLSACYTLSPCWYPESAVNVSSSRVPSPNNPTISLCCALFWPPFSCPSLLVSFSSSLNRFLNHNLGVMMSSVYTLDRLRQENSNFKHLVIV